MTIKQIWETCRAAEAVVLGTQEQAEALAKAIQRATDVRFWVVRVWQAGKDHEGKRRVGYAVQTADPDEVSRMRAEPA